MVKDLREELAEAIEGHEKALESFQQSYCKDCPVNSFINCIYFRREDPSLRTDNEGCSFPKHTIFPGKVSCELIYTEEYI